MPANRLYDNYCKHCTVTLRPTTLTVWLFIALFAFGVAVALAPVPDWSWPLAAALLVALVAADALWVSAIRPVSVERQVNRNLPVNSWSQVQLEVHHQQSQNVHVQVFDHHPRDVLVRGQPHGITIPPRQKARIHYRIKPLQRGADRFTGVEVLLRSPLGLWRRRQWIAHEHDIRIYPNFADVAKYALLATDNRLSQLGVRRRQRRGEGQDFRQLREYRLGDPMKQIDWKASSRYRKLISREYQDERDQQVLFLIDCSRRMRHMEGGQAHLDQALNAMLLVAYIAGKQGDAVGFLSFGGEHKATGGSGERETWASPEKGAATVNYLLDKSYDLRPTLQAADYLAAAKQLLTLQRKRSLVIVMTNTRDEDLGDLLHAVRLLARKHLVVLADLQEPGLEQGLHHSVQNLDDALQYHAVYDYLQLRRQSHDQFRHAGALCMDTTAAQLPLRLVNQYLDIKQAGVL